MILLGWLPLSLYGQQSQPTDSSEQAVIQKEPQKKRKKFDILPALSYAPETKLTLGGIGYYYPDFSGGDPTTRQSNVNFLAVYTLAKQVLIEGYWDLFTPGNKYRFRGEALYNKYPDRLYGVGNEADWLILQVPEGDEAPDSLNYLPYSNQFIRFRPVLLRKITESISAGLQYEMEYVYDFTVHSEDYRFGDLNDSLACIATPIEGVRSGLGVNFLLDTRDYLLNPIKGTYLEVGGMYYAPWLGSDYTFGNILVDYRKYINTVGNHTLALRAYLNLRPGPADQPIQYRGLSRVGGNSLVRGYFKGTFADRHLNAFEMEYRLPLWPENTDATFWQFWRKVGVVGFLSGAQVYHDMDEWALNRFHLAGGFGLRLLFNKESRVNIRIDYGWGLTKNSAGPGKRQSGLYFYLAESF
jgi:hypothetical protein